MKHFRKIIFIFMSMIFLVNSIVVFAQEEQKGCIRCMDVYSSPASMVDVPITIADNPGIMGLAIELQYDKSILQPVTVKAGEVFSTGTVYDNIGTETTEGVLKVMWSSIENVTMDGELVVITFQSLAGEEAVTDLNLSYSQPDTFNATWEDVSMETKSGSVRLKGSVESQEYTSEEEKRQEQLESMKIAGVIKNQTKSKSDSQEKNQIEKEADTEKENDLSETDISETGNNGQAEPQKDDATNEDFVKVAIEKALQEQDIKDVDSVGSLDKETKERFVNRVALLLEENGVETSGLWEDTTINQKVEILCALWNDATGEKSLEAAEAEVTGVSENAEVLKKIIWIVGACIVIIIAILLYRYSRRKRGAKNEE